MGAVTARGGCDCTGGLRLHGVTRSALADSRVARCGVAGSGEAPREVPVRTPMQPEELVERPLAMMPRIGQSSIFKSVDLNPHDRETFAGVCGHPRRTPPSRDARADDVGKTFISQALGHIACRHGYHVRFARADELGTEDR